MADGTISNADAASHSPSSPSSNAECALRSLPSLSSQPSLSLHAPVSKKAMLDTSDIPESLRPFYMQVLQQHGKGWNPTWDHCIEAWLAFERASSFKNTTKSLSGSVKPPVELTQYTSKEGGRSLTSFNSNIASVYLTPAKYNEEWWEWYHSVQPNNRGSAENTARSQNDDGSWSWTPMCKSGKSGVFLLMISLAWWGEALHTAEINAKIERALTNGDEVDPTTGKSTKEIMKCKEFKDSREAWDDAVDDLNWCLGRLKDFALNSNIKKRK